MDITDIRVKPLDNEGSVKAIVSITIDNEFVVHDIKIIEGDRGLFVAMPSKRIGLNEYRDVAHPINFSARIRLQKIILDKYRLVSLADEIL